MTSTSSSPCCARPGAICQPGGGDPRRRLAAYQDLADVLSACDEAGIRNVRLPVRSRDRQSTTP